MPPSSTPAVGAHGDSGCRHQSASSGSTSRIRGVVWSVSGCAAKLPKFLMASIDSMRIVEGDFARLGLRQRRPNLVNEVALRAATFVKDRLESNSN